MKTDIHQLKKSMKPAVYKKVKYIMMNLFAPGLGYCALHKWIRGVSMLLLTGGSLVWLIIAFSQNIIGIYYSFMNDTPVKFSLSGLLAPIVLFFLLQGSCLLDILFFCKMPESRDGKDDIVKSLSKSNSSEDSSI